MKYIVIILVMLTLSMCKTYAHENGRTDPAWEETSPEIQKWYKELRQPDSPGTFCCGESDAYWCDTVYVRATKTYCKITDERPDAPRGRPHVPLGTEILIPNHKLKHDQGNPTGHAVVFLSPNLFVFCFVQGTQT